MKKQNSIKKTLTAGLITLLPVLGTLWLLKVIIFAAEDFFHSFIPPQFRPANLIGYDIPGLGMLAAIIVVFFVGIFTRFYLGRRLISYGDKIFSRIPFGRGIYNAIKQFLGTITGSQKKSFRQVVLVEYPSPRTYAIGFLTGYPNGEIQAKTKDRIATVFLPTTPNPTSGYLLMFPEDKMIMLDMTVEEAFKFIVSGGVVVKEDLPTLSEETI